MRRPPSLLTGPLAVLVAVGVLAGVVRTGAQASEQRLFVSAVDARGEPVAGLGPEAFVVREDGARREIVRVSPATEPIDLVLLVDNSSAASAAHPFLREALDGFVGALGSETRTTLVGLADRPTVLVGDTRDMPRVRDAVGRLFPMPQTGMTLLDAVVETAQGVARRPSPRAVMVAVITDGVEFTNRYAKDVVRRLDEARLPLHAVTIGRFDLSDEHAARERGFLLESGARASGGQWIRLLTPHALDETLQRLTRELTSQYEVVYARPPRLIPPERLEITSARQGVEVRGTAARDTGV